MRARDQLMTDRRAEPLPPAVSVREAAGQWTAAVAAAGFLPAGRARTRTALEQLLSDLVPTLGAPTLDPMAGHRVGVRLVELRMASPAALGATITVLSTQLPQLAGDALSRARIPAVLGQLTAGFSTAQRTAAVRAAETLNQSEKLHWRRVYAGYQQRLRHQQLHDPHSRLPNRAHLHAHLTDRAAHASDTDRLGVCLLSIGDFDDLSDSYGDDAINDLLADIGARLRLLATEHDYFAAHLGDDLFAIVTATTCLDDLAKAADHARRALAGLTVGAHQAPVTITDGLVEAPAANTSAPHWIRDSRCALGWARQEGLERAWFDPARAAADLLRHRLAATIPHALDNGEFICHYQPIVDLNTGAITGVEALARWQQPQRLLGPQDFIPVAEHQGLIYRLGASILEQACRQAAQWRALGHHLTLSVNVSPYQLADPALTATIRGILHATGLPAISLQLEITESAAIERHHTVLRDLASLGIQIALDDFGTGYSNFAALIDLPIACAKLDRRFIQDAAAGSSRAIALLRHLLGMLRRLNITAVAEGIETAAQQYLLTGLGYQHGQGFHLARPQAADALTNHLIQARHKATATDPTQQQRREDPSS
jgi:diguanylate cyclase (GGDEF)-like protein